jgi:hypothetical protein
MKELLNQGFRQLYFSGSVPLLNEEKWLVRYNGLLGYRYVSQYEFKSKQQVGKQVL